MLESFVGGLVLVMQWKTFSLMLVGVGIGFWVGILPGIGGLTAMALMIAFVYKMTPPEGFAFLLGMYAVAATTGDITSVLFGIPGEPVSAATVLDGHPMAKQGQAGRALGAVLMSSLVGGLVGAVTMALAIQMVRPLVLMFASPELFMLCLVALSFIGCLSSQGRWGLLRGFLAGWLGLLFSTIGQDHQVGILRFTLGTLYLWDGLDLVPVVVGIFAIPEIIDLAVRGTAIAGDALPKGIEKGVMEGFKDTFRHWWLVIRCSMIGTFTGFLPGLGGVVAQWLAYGHAVQSAAPEERSRFGKGDVRGVLAPGAANNAICGGALVTTVAFGVPASSLMAVLLAAFLVMGLVPGPDMLSKHLTLTFSMVWTLIIANILAVALSMLCLKQLVRLTTIRGSLLIPFILFLVFIGGYTANNSLLDLLSTLFFGGLGYLMVLFGWPRPPFILGLILGKLAENYLFISTSRHGLAWMSRPMVLIMFGLMLVAIAYPFFHRRWASRREERAA